MLPLNYALGMVAAAALIVPSSALTSIFPNAQMSGQVQTTTLTSSDFALKNTTGGLGDSHEVYDMYYAVHYPPIAIDAQAFFVNAISVVFSLGLKEFDAAAEEKAKVISMPDSEEVVFIIGAGKEARGKMPRERMLRILEYFIPKLALEVGFFSMVCDLTLHDSEEVVAHIEVRARAAEGIQPEQVNGLASLGFESAPASIGWNLLWDSPADVGRIPRYRSRQRRQSSQLGIDYPRLVSTYSEDVDIGMTPFYLGMATPVLTLSYKPKSTLIEEVDLTQPLYGIRGVIRGFKPPRTDRFMTVEELIESLMLLTMEQLQRSRAGKKYNAVTTQIFAPEDWSKQMGVMTVQKGNGAGDGELTQQ